MYTTINKPDVPRLEGYTGKKQYVVRHPSHGMIIVCAPDEYGALRVAAEEWVSVEDEIPSDDDDELEFFCMTNATGKCGGVLPMEWEVATIRGKTVRRWKWRSRISPWAVTHWMKRPAPPGEDNNVPTKAPNEPLSLEQLREMDGEPVFNADAAEEYFSDLLVFYRNTANDIFRKDNEGRHASNQTYSAEYQKYVGMQMAMREVLEYFSKFEL